MCVALSKTGVDRKKLRKRIIEKSFFFMFRSINSRTFLKVNSCSKMHHKNNSEKSDKQIFNLL